MYLGSNSISLSMTLYTFCMLFPFNGGSISNEKAVLLLLLIRSITFMLFIYLFGWTNVHKKQLCLSAQYVDCLCCLNFPRVDIPCFVAEFPSCLFVASSQRYDIICNLHLSFLLFLPFLKG